MSQFYARYIPQGTISTPAAEKNGVKRPATSRPKHEAKKRKIDKVQHGTDLKVAGHGNGTLIGKDEPLKISERREPKRQKEETYQGSQKSRGLHPSVESPAVADHSNHSSSKQLDDQDDGNVNDRHAKVLSRFSESKHQAAQRSKIEDRLGEADDTNDGGSNTVPIVHDLEAIPQPKAAPASHHTPAYSTSPEWLRNPIRVDDSTRQSFADLELNQVLVANLKSQQKEIALPVQSAVLPLLLDKYVEQRPDLCVAAATGSGKTFAYILPILHELRTRKLVRLRAVIVVPTRSLVRQVVQAIEQCSAGIDLRVGSAEGSKSIAEEQRQFVEEIEVYNPRLYNIQQATPIDWSDFSLEDIVEQAGKRDPLSGIGYVVEHVSKIDILVCTPGRLVEHLQKTKGFSLDDAQWFVVDEADRLLNESYHEWLDVVLPALKSQQALEQRNSLLKYMHMDIPRRQVTKILLSATMTNDISHLLALELTHPKLVVVESSNSQSNATNIEHNKIGSDTDYMLPSRLYENATPLKDTENKPLYLIELLTRHISMQFFNAATETQPVLNGFHDNGSPSSNSVRRSLSSSVSGEDGSTGSSDSSSSDNESDSTSVSSLSSSDSASSSDDDSEVTSKPTNVRNNIINTSRQPAQDRPRVLIFTKSIESAHRLSRLLSILLPNLSSSIATFTRSSSNPGGASDKSTRSLLRTRSKILQSFQKGTTCILISTDLAARGLDIPQLEHVINYDVPSSALAYVHRVGRTARAGLEGHAWTLVEHKQGKWFWETIGGKGAKEGEKRVLDRGERVVQKVNITIDEEQWMDRYEEALQRLGEDVRGQ